VSTVVPSLAGPVTSFQHSFFVNDEGTAAIWATTLPARPSRSSAGSRIPGSATTCAQPAASSASGSDPEAVSRRAGRATPVWSRAGPRRGWLARAAARRRVSRPYGQVPQPAAPAVGPATADEDNVTASYRDGILTITIGLKAEKKESARKIEITGAK
jgi:Hsp20/alpha crystallin family